jgi:hypothetical protein
MEAQWKRQTAANRSSQEQQAARGAVWATNRGRPQQMLAPYKQEVARSSRAPPITRKPSLGTGLAEQVVDGVDRFASVGIGTGAQTPLY